MPKRILAASDLSEASNEGLVQAHVRARATGARLGICHVLERASGTLEGADVEGEARKAIASQLAACAAGASAEIFIDSGTPHRAIVHRADAWSADLLVIASHGRSIASRAPIGSVAEQVARNAHCPVLVARDSPAGGVVLAATDFSDPSTPAIAAAAAEARLRRAKRASSTERPTMRSSVRPSSWGPTSSWWARAGAPERAARAGQHG